MTILEMIGRGWLLPSVTTLSSSVGRLSAFIDALRRRLDVVEEVDSNIVPLRSVVGYCTRSHCRPHHAEAVGKHAVMRLEGLNEKHGTLILSNGERVHQGSNIGIETYFSRRRPLLTVRTTRFRCRRPPLGDDSATSFRYKAIVQSP